MVPVDPTQTAEPLLLAWSRKLCLVVGSKEYFLVEMTPPQELTAVVVENATC
jgi:hypothetical protein